VTSTANSEVTIGPTPPAEAAKILLGRPVQVVCVEAETTPITFVRTFCAKDEERNDIYAIEQELHQLYPDAHFNFAVTFDEGRKP